MVADTVVIRPDPTPAASGGWRRARRGQV